MKLEIDGRMGARLKARRKYLDMSLEAVASLINLSPGYLSLVESGRRSLQFKELGALMEILNIGWDDLVDKEQFLLEQEIRNFFEQFNKDDLKIILTVCNLISNSKANTQITKILYLYNQ